MLKWNGCCRLHLTKTYCLYLLSCMDVKPGHWLITVCTPSALHGTTVFGVFLSVAGVRALNLFSFFCKTMSIAHLIDQQTWFFGKKIIQSESSVLKTLACLKRNQCNALRSKYGLCPYDGTYAIKRAVFEKIFVALTMWFYFFVGYILYFPCFTFYVLVVVVVVVVLVVCLLCFFYGFNVLCV